MNWKNIVKLRINYLVGHQSARWLRVISMPVFIEEASIEYLMPCSGTTHQCCPGFTHIELGRLQFNFHQKTVVLSLVFRRTLFGIIQGWKFITNPFCNNNNNNNNNNPFRQWIILLLFNIHRTNAVMNKLTLTFIQPFVTTLCNFNKYLVR